MAAIWAGNSAALDYLQDRAGYSRIGHHGGTAGRWIDAHDWIVTSFFQHDSRDGDPQLHIHNPVLNLAECADGQWRTLDSRGITRHRGAAGALAERVTEEYLSRVLRVRFASRPDGKAREVVGMPAELIAALSTRSRTLTPRAAALAAEFEARYGRPPNPLQLDRLKRQATLATRRPKSKDAETLAQRGERIDTLMRELEGELRDGLAAVARSIPRLPDQAQPPAFSPTAVIETALADVQAARATWTRPDLTRAIANALPDSLGGLDAPAVRRLLDGLTDEALTHADVQQVGGERDDALPAVAELRLADGSSAYDGAAGRTYALRSHIAGERALAKAAIETGAVAVEPSAARGRDRRPRPAGPGPRRRPAPGAGRNPDLRRPGRDARGAGRHRQVHSGRSSRPSLARPGAGPAAPRHRPRRIPSSHRRPGRRGRAGTERHALAGHPAATRVRPCPAGRHGVVARRPETWSSSTRPRCSPPPT